MLNMLNIREKVRKTDFNTQKKHIKTTPTEPPKVDIFGLWWFVVEFELSRRFSDVLFCFAEKKHDPWNPSRVLLLHLQYLKTHQNSFKNHIFGLCVGPGVFLSCYVKGQNLR